MTEEQKWRLLELANRIDNSVYLGATGDFLGYCTKERYNLSILLREAVSELVA